MTVIGYAIVFLVLLILLAAAIADYDHPACRPEQNDLSRLSPDSNSGASLPSSSEPTPGGAVGDGETFDEDTGTFQVERVNGGWC